MLATFIIEIALAVYTIARYKLTPISRLAAALLVCLAAFQLAEYNVCEGAWGVDSLTWARIGFVAITLLIPIGLHITLKIAARKNNLLLGAVYASALAFALFFLVVGHGVESQACTGNYVIVNIAPWADIPYALYYYGWLIVTTVYAWQLAAATKVQSTRRALRALALGYLAFIVPTTAANIIDPSTIAGIPSIMCGFAVILALVLAFIVLPSYFKK